MNAGGQADVILLDFLNAFDKVPHNQLIVRNLHFMVFVDCFNLDEKFFLTNRTQCVILNGQSSHVSNVLLGVP